MTVAKFEGNKQRMSSQLCFSVVRVMNVLCRGIVSVKLVNFDE